MRTQINLHLSGPSLCFSCEPLCQKTYLLSSAPKEVSKQPAHPWIDQSLFSTWSTLASLAILNAPSEDSDQTVQMCRLMSQSKTKPTIRLVWPAKTQISLLICPVWSESLLITYAFYSLQSIQRGIKENPCHTGWMCRLICVFAGHIGLIVGFVVHWLIP